MSCLLAGWPQPRTGSEEIWIADSNGQNPRQVTSFAGPSVGSPRWSPDGKWIAFDSTAPGRPAIYVISAGGGPARRITSPTVSSVRPSWSRDGRWIYFGSDQTGGWQIWKIWPSGGSPVQLTRHGGRAAFEDRDAKFIYYTKAPPEKGIWRVFVSGGAEMQFTSFGIQGRWGIGDRGIYYLSAPDHLVFEDVQASAASPSPLPACDSATEQLT